MKFSVCWVVLSVLGLVLTQHIKDPTKCTKTCTPPGYEGDIPEEFPEDVERIECKGTYCAKADHGPPAEDNENEKCKQHWSCSVHCSEVCCVCLRECI